MTLSILLISGWAERPAFLKPDVPYFRTSLERSGNRFLDGTVEGKVLSGKRKEDRYVLEVQPEDEKGTVLVYVDAAKEAVSELVGREGLFEGRFFLFQKATNFGEFCVRSYYDALGIPGGFLADSYKTKEGRKDLFRSLSFRIRESVRETIEYYCGNESGIYLALLLSDRTALQEDTGNALEATGLLFLLTSSGFLFSFFGNAVFQFLKKRMKNRIVPAVISGLFLLVLGALNGFSFSFLRGLIVFLVRIAAPVLKRKFDVLSAFSLSLVILLVFWPQAVFLAAFRFAAALMIALGAIVPVISDYFFRSTRRERAILQLFSVKCSFLPLTVRETFRPGLYAFFGEAAMLFLRAVLTMLSFVSITGDCILGRGNLFSQTVFRISGFFAEMYRHFPEFLRKLPFQGLVNGHPSAFRIGVYLGLFALIPVVLRILLIRRKFRKESEERIPGVHGKRAVLLSLVLIFIFGIIFLRAEKPGQEETRLTMADVGQGDGFILESSDAAVLIDGGSTDREDVGEILLNSLSFYGRRKVDAVFLSHDDRDHYSGVLSLIRSGRMEICRIFLPLTKARADEFSEIRAAADDNDIPVEYLKAGDLVDIGPFSFEVLWPAEGTSSSGNDTSLVLSVQDGRTSFLFTGDIPEETEGILLPFIKRHDYLKVAHHGSKYSSSERFLERVAPLASFISYGKYNAYGHPAKETLNRLDSVSGTCYLSGRDGAAALLISEEKASVSLAAPN